MTTLDATIGSPTANSYVDVATAAAVLPLVASASRVTAWTAQTPENQALYLMRAVKQLEMYMTFEGIRFNEFQPLDWPRDWVYGPDRQYVLPSNEIPVQVQEAQCLMALAISEGFDQDAAAGAPIDRLQISTLRIQFDNHLKARGSTLIPSEVIEKLRGFGQYVAASGMARAVDLVRA